MGYNSVLSTQIVAHTVYYVAFFYEHLSKIKCHVVVEASMVQWYGAELVAVNWLGGSIPSGGVMNKMLF